MSNHMPKEDPTQKRKNRKDFLYRIGKLKQNKILCQKTENEQEYNQQPSKQAHKISNQKLEQQLDFQLLMPAINPVPPVRTSPLIQSQSDSQNLKQKGKNDDQTETKTEAKKECELRNHHDPEEIQGQEKEEIQTVFNRKPILFEDFDEEINNQEEADAQGIQPQDGQQNDQNVKADNQQQSESSSCSEEEIKGVSITSNSLQGNVIIKITNKKELVLSRLPPGIILKCIIRRSSDIFNPEFDFYLNNGLKHMMSAKKYSLAKKQIFKLSMELGKYRERDIIGSIMANTLHNTYWIYKEAVVKQKVEYEIKGTVHYEKMIKNRERQMTVNLFVDKNKQMKVEPQKLAHDLLENGDLKLKNSEFKVKQVSSKNYLLFDEQDKDYQYLKMTKVSDHMFEVEIQHPLSPLQAFAISLTRFDAELK